MSGIMAIILALGVVVGGSMVDGDPITALLSATAAIIVFGGTVAALMLHFGFADMVKGFTRIAWLLKPPRADLPAFIEKVAEWSNLSRSQGTLALESQLKDTTDAFERQGLQMIIDNTRAEDLHPTLSILAENAARGDLIAGQLWEAAGGYTPTIGIMGAVLGLIHVMMRLDHPEELGQGIATAFVATIYGVGFANLVALPLGTRLKQLAEELERERNVVIQGFVLLGEGKPGVLIKQTLATFLTDHGKPKPQLDEAEAEPAGAAGQVA